jgi:hypothetical protein
LRLIIGGIRGALQDRIGAARDHEWGRLVSPAISKSEEHTIREAKGEPA